MGQCASSKDPFRNGQIMVGTLHPPLNPSLSDTSQDNNSHAELSDSVLPSEQEVSGEEARMVNFSQAYSTTSKKSSIRMSFRKSSIASLIPKVKGSFAKSKKVQDNQLSAAFNMSSVDFKIVMLDINSASEEELMTLTGITRHIAHEIIEHRIAIGAFKKVEDLALVSGVGAAKLQAIKPEICVSRKLPSAASVTTTDASSSSCNVNGDSASVTSSPKISERHRRRKRDPVNINTASIFQLMTVDGITQELAAHTVHYRDRKGPFKTVYDLRKVAGFNTRLISALGPYLTTENNSNTNGHADQNGHTLSHRRTASLPPGPLFHSGGFVPSTPVFKSPSPVFPSLSQFTRVLDETCNSFDADTTDHQNGNELPCENALRVLSWNMDSLSVEKARNPGIVHVLVELLLRYHIRVAVIQGIQEPLALQTLCEDMNKHDGIVHPYTCSTGDGSVGYLHQGPLEIRSWPLLGNSLAAVSLATVENNDVSFALVTSSFANLSGDHPATLIPQFIKAILDLSLTERIICLADFSHHNHSPYVEQFQDLGYRPIIAKDESTSFIQGKLDPRDQMVSNILVSRYAQKALTGQLGTIREGLTHLLIPNGWSWNGPASIHCPIWVELKTDEEADESF